MGKNKTISKTQEEITHQWIANAINYLVELTEKKDSTYSAGFESDCYDGRSFHYKIDGNGLNKGLYKWCAINYRGRLVFYFKIDNMATFFKSKYTTDPPAYSFVIEDCKNENISKEDKVKLETMYNEMCNKVAGLNEHVIKSLTQCEQEFDINIDTETMFASFPVKETKEETTND